MSKIKCDYIYYVAHALLLNDLGGSYTRIAASPVFN